MNEKSITGILATMRKGSAWRRGVIAYARDLLEDYPDGELVTEKGLLNGAMNWREYSEGGITLVYDRDIAKRLCAPWKLRRTDNGRLPPNGIETWIEYRTRALIHAKRAILRAVLPTKTHSKRKVHTYMDTAIVPITHVQGWRWLADGIYSKTLTDIKQRIKDRKHG
jgi:hypothetical protein